WPSGAPDAAAQRREGALQVHADRGLRGVQHRGDLLGGQSLAALQLHRRALLWRQRLHRLPDTAHLLVLVHPLAGIIRRRGLALGEIVRIAIVPGVAPDEEAAPAPSAATTVQAAVDQDAVEPGR